MNTFHSEWDTSVSALQPPPAKKRAGESYPDTSYYVLVRSRDY